MQNFVKCPKLKLFVLDATELPELSILYSALTVITDYLHLRFRTSQRKYFDTAQYNSNKRKLRDDEPQFCYP